MPPTRTEYMELVQRESVGVPYKTSMDVALGMIRTAAVSFEHLTSDEHWDRFLSYIQRRLEDAKKERDHSLLVCGGAVGDALLIAQQQYHYWRGEVSALEFAIALPNQIKQGYADVKK